MTTNALRQPLGECTAHPTNYANTVHGCSTGARIARWGLHAERFVHHHASAVLVAVFARSLYLEAEGNFLCLGDASIGEGPLNAIVGANEWPRVARVLPPVGSEVRIDPETIAIGDAMLNTKTSSVWRPPPWPRSVAATALAAALDDLGRRAREQSPGDGLARIVFGPAAAPTSDLDRIARPRVDRLRQWASARLSKPGRAPAPIDLLGLGPGLTPSGDDLLCGALVALHAIGKLPASRDLHAAIAKAPPSATSALSRAFLRAAADGQCCQPLHAIILALLENQIVGQDLEALARVGHTSGWDALAGAALVLQTFSSIAGR